MRPFALATLAVFAVAPAMGAQERGVPAKEQREEARTQRPLTTDSTVSIPRDMMPPAGKCRIWMRGVPARQQPAPTDCTTALRQSPANGVLVFGPARRDLSPFDARNPWAAPSSKVTREGSRNGSAARDIGTDQASSRGDSSARPRRPSREPASTDVREATPSTRTAPAAREAPRESPPRRDPPPPPKKKPE